jgi:hypothetical protein
VVESTASGTAIASYPDAIEFIGTHPSSHTWAGKISQHLHLFTLEGITGDGEAC